MFKIQRLVRRTGAAFAACVLLGSSAVGLAGPAAASSSIPACDSTNNPLGSPYAIYKPFYIAGVTYYCSLWQGLQDPLPGHSNASPIWDLQLALDVCNGANLIEDGIYGPATKAAVIAVQRAHGLTQDGVFGPQTASVMGWHEYYNGTYVGCYGG